MKAELITRFRDVSESGEGIELVVWRVPASVAPSTHLCNGKRVIGFDNERGKGDHKHVGGRELPYDFIDVDRLLDDFFAEIEQWKSAL